jgi:putative flippase GtrA
VVAGIAGLINYIMFVVLISLLSIHDLLAVLFGIGVGIVFNYTGNSLWTFRKKIKKPKIPKGN